MGTVHNLDREVLPDLLREKTVALLQGMKKSASQKLQAEAINFAYDMFNHCATTLLDLGVLRAVARSPPAV